MLSNFGVVEPGLFRCAQPDAKGFRDLATFGVATVLKLNSENEYPFAREESEFPHGKVVEFELSTFEPSRRDAEHVADTIQALRAGLAVHCSHGRDRTGLAIGAWRIRHCGWTLEQVEAERRLYGNAWILDLVDREIVEVLQVIVGAR